MGTIRHPPRPIRYRPPKNLRGAKILIADIIARAKFREHFEGWGDYCRIIDRLRWRKGGHEELRFCYYYRKPNGTDKDWVFGQGSGNMRPTTLTKLIKRAKTNPDYGDFGRTLDNIKVE